ncbi:MAG TPA: alpha-amylase family glycosyl hydrolase, partial [Flavobacterium sp.]|nr:alpha-amylase family glycosyl hydrolase [Flavobacterium sp.]
MNLWYKNAIIYGLDVKTFQDSNGDGIGDFRGLTKRLSYLSELGINTLWLLPFYPSPNRDNGYDVSDFYNINPELGTLDDFQTFVQEAHRLKIRIVIDLVVHHTSTEHPWFKAARSDEKSPYRDYYIWSKKHPKILNRRNSFPGKETDIWHYDDMAKAWYFHRFYHFQPDLNFNNPEVQEEVIRIMNFWLALGIDGFRIDAAGLLFEYKGLPHSKHKTPWILLKKMNTLVSGRGKDGILLGEADTPPEYMKTFFGEGDRIHMLLNFLMNQSIFAALAAENSEPIE